MMNDAIPYENVPNVGIHLKGSYIFFFHNMLLMYLFYTYMHFFTFIGHCFLINCFCQLHKGEGKILRTTCREFFFGADGELICPLDKVIYYILGI